MTIEIQFTASKFTEILKARLIANRPCITQSLKFAGDIFHVAWLDVGHSEIRTGTDSTGFNLNEEFSPNDIHAPLLGGVWISLNRLVLRQAIKLHVCTRSAMKIANNSQATTIAVNLLIDFNILVRITKTGVPRLCVEFSELVSHDIPIDESEEEENEEDVESAEEKAVKKLLAKHVNSCTNLRLGALARLAGGETPRVVNGGIAATPALSSVMIRFETESPDGASKVRWQNFYAGSFSNRLHGNEWALFLPHELITSPMAEVLENNLAGSNDFSLQSAINVNWSPLGIVPMINVTFHGEIIDACIGIDLDVDVTITATITVPQPNVLRTSISLSWDGDFWEELGCEVVSAQFWPAVGLLFVAEGKIEWWQYFAAIAVGPIAIFNSIVGYLSTDDPASELPAPSEWMKDSDTTWHQDEDFPSSLGGIEGLGLSHVFADPDGLILSGSVTLTQPLIPTLETKSTGFGWRLANPCKSPWAKEADAHIDITAAPTGVEPRLDLRLCGVKILNDPLNFYGGGKLSFPGQWFLNATEFRVEVKNPPAAFAAAPYDLEVLILSNQGARLITIPAPKALEGPPSDPTQKALLEANWKVWYNVNCLEIQSKWDQLGIMNPAWVIDPPPEEIFAQHWWIEISGGSPGEVVTLRNGLGRELMTSTTQEDGRVQLSSIVENASRSSDIWVAKNGINISKLEFEERAKTITKSRRPSRTHIAMKQTLLVLQHEFAISGQVTDIALDYVDGMPTVLLESEGGIVAYRIDNRSPMPQPIDARTAEQCFARAARTRARWGRFRSVSIEAHQGELGGRIMDNSDASSAREIAVFQTRPWNVGGMSLGRTYARISDTGETLRIYRIGRTHVGHRDRPRIEEVFGAKSTN